MARYRLFHPFSPRTWVCENPDGSYSWREVKNFKESKLFPNFKAAKAAFDSMPIEYAMYHDPIKPHYMKFFDSPEQREREEKYQENMRLLRQWGH